MPQSSTLIIGGSGFLGSYLAAECRQLGCKPLGVGRSNPPDPSLWADFTVTESESCDFEQFVDGRSVGACFFLAGSSSVQSSFTDPYRDFTTLLPGLHRLLEYVRERQPNCHIILFSSAAVYGNPSRLPIAETDRIAPVSPYGIHKWLAEELLHHYANLFSIRSSSLRIFSAYGDGLRRQLFWDVLKKYEMALSDNTTEVVLSGTGQESRDFIHARDVALAAIRIKERADASVYQTFNVANGQEVSISQAVEKLLSFAPEKISLRFTGDERPGDPKNWQADIGKLAELGYHPSVDIEEGLRQYFAWFQQLERNVSFGTRKCHLNRYD